MSDSEKKILELLEDKRITVEEAHRLLGALRSEGGPREGPPKAEARARTVKAKYLRVTVQPDPEHERASDVDRVNIRVPMALLRSGMKFTSLLPDQARDKVSGALRDKGIDFDMRNLKEEDFDELVEALSELEVDVRGSDGEVVKVFVE